MLFLFHSPFILTMIIAPLLAAAYVHAIYTVFKRLLRSQKARVTKAASVYRDLRKEYTAVRTAYAGPDETDVCGICMEPCAVSLHYTILGCTHVFHSACIRPWLIRNSTCPNCRRRI